MSDQSKQSESTDPRVQAAIREYLERVDRGEVVNRDEFLVRHIEIAAALRSFFAAEEPLRKMATTRISEESSATSTRSIAAHGQETVPPKPQRGGSLGAMGSGLAGQFGRYRILRALGKGAMGAVYLAEDSQLERQVALKTPHFEDDPTGELVARFYREARAAAMLRQANICPVYDVGQIDGKHFISMAYIEGRPLSDVIHGDKPPTERQMVIVLHKLARALQEAHDHGIVHRDLKPANIMVDQKGEPIIMDFGLARKRKSEGEASLTQSGMILGSPAYMSPEQIEGDPDSVGPASDQYSLGVVLYEMLTGQLPFRGSVVNVLAQVITKGATPPSELQPGIDPRIEAVCVRMMSKRAADRFPSMKAVADQLAAIVKSPAPAPSAAEKSPTASRPPAAPDASRENASASQIRKSIKSKPLTETDVASLEELVRKCLRHRDYKQMIQIIERIPEERRNDALQRLLEKARAKVDEISFLICEIDEADRLEDGKTALKKAEELLQIKPGHHRAREIQQKYSGYGEGAAARIGPLSHFTRPWNEGGWILWSVLAFGLAVFAVMYGVMVIYFGKTAIVVDIKDPGVEVTVKGTTLTVTGPDKQSVKVTPGEQQLIITGASFEATARAFSLKKGDTKVVTISIHDGKVVAQLDGKPLDALRDAEQAQRGRVKPTQVAAPQAQITDVREPKTAQFTVVRGQWNVEGDELVQSAVAQHQEPAGHNSPLLTFGDLDWSNYDLVLEAKRTGGDNGCAVFFHWLDENHWRDFGVGVYQNHSIELISMDDGKWRRESSHHRFRSIDENHWYSIRLQVRGDTVECLLEGKLEFKGTDQKFTHGRVGLGTWGSAYRFRNIKVTSPSGTVLWAGLPPLNQAASHNPVVKAERRESTASPHDPDRLAAEAVLARGGSVSVRVDGRELTIERNGSLPSAPFELTRVGLRGRPNLTDAALESLESVSHLLAVDLYSSPVGDAGIAHLRNQVGLQHLDIGGTRVTDSGLAIVEGLPHLKVLGIEKIRITDAGVAHLENLTELDTLWMGNGPQITDAGLAHLEKLTNLRRITLWHAPLKGAGLKHMIGLKRLQSLAMGSTHINDEGLAYLKDLQQLRRLDLGKTRVTDAGLTHLRGLTHLDSLSLALTRISNAGLGNLKSLTELRRLSLGGTHVNDAGLRQLDGLTQLQDLDLTGTRITNSGLEHLKNHAQLQKLHLGGTHVTDAGLHHLEGLTNLDELDLTDTKVTAAGVGKLQKSIPACKILANSKGP